MFHWRDLAEYRSVNRVISGRNVSFVVERTNRGCVHACTVSDIALLLGHIPADDWDGLNLVVLRQPKRKEAILNGVWGRLAYGGEIGRPQDGIFTGAAIFLESMPPDFEFTLSASMGPPSQKELERLRRDGHVIARQGRRFVIKCSLDTVRNTQLYRTMLHEVGHWVDWLQKVQRPVAPPDFEDDEYGWRTSLQDQYDRRPRQEREHFANQYADRMWEQLSSAGMIPFARVLDSEGLDPTDFIGS